jgi:hypothetical protein
MPGKTARSAARQPLGLPKVTAAAHATRLSCQNAGQASNAPAFGETATRLGEAIDSLERTTQWLLSQKTSDTQRLVAVLERLLQLTCIGPCPAAAIPGIRIFWVYVCNRIVIERGARVVPLFSYAKPRLLRAAAKFGLSLIARL